MKLLFFAAFSLVLLSNCAHKTQATNHVRILPVEDVIWEKLNPLRGDKSPQAGTLWGDRKGSIATGFLAKFVDGFSSPPHIHNVSYRAIVIEGLVHNDDPKAAKMLMPNSSYWTQPAGEAHITSAKGKVNIALVEIDKGPYLVHPINQKFDNGERPFNIHASNIIWKQNNGYESVDLWADSNGSVVGSMIKYTDNVDLAVNKSKIVTIKGKTLVQGRQLAAGSLINIDGKSELRLSCETSECILYLKFG